MKKTVGYSIIIPMCCLLFFAAGGPDMTVTGDIFPDLDGWSKGDVEIYLPHNLFEYIDGAAEVYLSYDFQKLLSLTYEKEENQSITVDIYQHSNPSTGFGIYSAEKPVDGNFLRIGTQGYYETGVLNFFKGPYYIKLNGFDLKENDRTLLEATARLLDNKLDAEPVFPKVISCFPEAGKVKNSERYIFKNFLGHRFLHSAFVADYRIDNTKFQVFIMETGSPAEAEKLISSYLEFLKNKNEKFEIDEQKIYRFQDPYYRSSGTLGLKSKGNIVWGLFYKDQNRFRSCMEKIEKNLKDRQLIEP